MSTLLIGLVVGYLAGSAATLATFYVARIARDTEPLGLPEGMRPIRAGGESEAPPRRS